MFSEHLRHTYTYTYICNCFYRLFENFTMWRTDHKNGSCRRSKQKWACIDISYQVRFQQKTPFAWLGKTMVNTAFDWLSHYLSANHASGVFCRNSAWLKCAFFTRNMYVLWTWNLLCTSISSQNKTYHLFVPKSFEMLAVDTLRIWYVWLHIRLIGAMDIPQHLKVVLL